MNAIVYHGSYESRELIRQYASTPPFQVVVPLPVGAYAPPPSSHRRYEFGYADGETNQATRSHYKFHALITR